MVVAYCINGPFEGRLVEVPNGHSLQIVRNLPGFMDMARTYYVHILYRWIVDSVPSLPDWPFVKWEYIDFTDESNWTPFLRYDQAKLALSWTVASINQTLPPLYKGDTATFPIDVLEIGQPISLVPKRVLAPWAINCFTGAARMLSLRKGQW